MVRKVGILSLLNIVLLAQEPEIIQDIQKFSRIVTISKENTLFQPYIESVYKGKDLEKLGISTLQEALQLVPGVDIYSDNLDMKTAIFRGSNPLAYGQTKLFIDGVLVNDVMVDQYSHYLAMPIELIKRIEVIRGPGSKIEGLNSYAGSIYVTTYSEDFDDVEPARAFTKYGSYRYNGVGFYKNSNIGSLKLYTELYLQKDDRYIFAGPDILATGVYAEENKNLAQSAEAPLWMRNYSFALYASWKNFKLKFRRNYYKRGHAFGMSYILPNKDDYMRLPSTLLELHFRKNIAPSLQLYWKSGLKKDSSTSLSHVAPENFIYISSNPSQYIHYDNGFWGYYQSKQQTIYGNIGIKYTIKNHKLNIGAYRYQEKTYSIKSITTDRTAKTSNIIDYSSIYPFINPDASRIATILYASDIYDVSDKLSIYYGINYESFSRYACFDPKISAIYRLNNSNIIKLMYAKSHRNPSWQELFTINNTTRIGNPNLKPERVTAYELSYTNRFMVDQFFQISLFYLKNRNIINNINADNIFLNHSKNSLYGIELEFKKMLTNTLEFYANYSYVYGERGCDQSLPNIANHLVKLYFLKQWSYNFSTSLSYHYIGNKGRFNFDTRARLKDFNIVDIAFSYRPKRELELIIALRNITDSHAKYPAPPYTYVNDYPYTRGREILLSIKKGF